MQDPVTVHDLHDAATPTAWWRQWWRRQTPVRQDRFAMLAPVAAVLLFLAAIVSAFGYLRLEEMDREQEAVKRDVEYARQRVRLRLLERQEQLMRVARDISNKEVDPEEFMGRAESMVSQYPELQAVTWIDERRRILASYAAPSVVNSHLRSAGEVLRAGETESIYSLARDLQQPVYSQPIAGSDNTGFLQLHIPLTQQGRFGGVILGEYSIDGLLRYGVPAEVSAKYAVALLDGKGRVLAGSSVPVRNPATQLLPWAAQPNEYEVPVSPVGNGLIIRAQAYRTSLGVIGSGLFWLVGALSAMTAWMLIGNWRHTRRRMQAQQALVAETNFRRAMENSMLTGMRALDMQGRITYVNVAFCQMTGWSEAELVGRTPPFPYWPEADREQLLARLDDELHGRTAQGGFQVRVKRKDGTLFDARLYLSPLIDAKGHQTGWMTSMTDITEPNRIRDQLSASYERFTTVLEALDASVSVAPLGSEELLFANKLYRLWFGVQTAGHLQMVAQAGVPDHPRSDESLDEVDSFVGLPTGGLTTAQSENAEIFVPELGKWLEVRSRYLNWVDGRLAQMVIATDITPRRHAEEQSSAQAERAQSASRLITMGEMASSVAHELNQPLTAITNYCNGLVSRIRGKQITEDDLLAALDKTARQAQRAGQIIQRIRSFVKRSEPRAVRRDPDGLRGGGTRRDRTAPSQCPAFPLCGRAPAQADGGPDPDRAGPGEPAEERRRVDRARAAPDFAAQRRIARHPQAGGRPARHRILRARFGPGPRPRGDGPPVRGVLLDQGRRHGHRPEPVPHHRRVAPGTDAGREHLQWNGSGRVSFFLLDSPVRRHGFEREQGRRGDRMNGRAAILRRYTVRSTEVDE